VVSRLEKVHSHGFFYNDIKPENLCSSLSTDNSHIYLIDFGVCRRFRSTFTKQHEAMKSGIKEKTGTSRYASLWTHSGVSPSRRDDLQQLFYTLAYLYVGTLPWDSVRETDPKKSLGCNISSEKEMHTRRNMFR